MRSETPRTVAGSASRPHCRGPADDRDLDLLNRKVLKDAVELEEGVTAMSDDQTPRQSLLETVTPFETVASLGNDDLQQRADPRGDGPAWPSSRWPGPCWRSADAR